MGGYNTLLRGESTIMDIWQSLFSFITIGIAIIAAYFIFRNGRKTIAPRAPLFIVCFLLFFYVGLVNLPLALPSVFQHVLGHSVWANYMPPPKLNITQVGGTWLVIRWRDPIQTAYFWVLLAGILWALLNIVQRRARKLNVFCLCLGIVLTVASFLLSFMCYPFCV
ncbi:MAG TPA: hypothetical protein VK764_01215 [Terracidiphilus sp.]|nr:hypothetical protein [Terracidiphilus sp.]